MNSPITITPDSARTLRIDRDRSRLFTRRRGQRVECVDGTAWITVPGDPRDVFLESGEAFTAERDMAVSVFAFGEPATVRVEAPFAPRLQRRDAWLVAAGLGSVCLALGFTALRSASFMLVG